MKQARVWQEKTMIPTYEIGAAEKNPIFLEKRVYQGSSGKVYPYPTVEKISNVKVDKEYEAVWLENEYLKVMVLPQLGGRIQRAYDKTNDYDFVYYNRVVKPALVGLTGPWISGGIEFNWPQHHRPTTFLPVDYCIGTGEDGSAYVLLHDVDQMYGTKGLTKIALYPGRAYIEITGQLYNRTSLPQTFLWWANPAVAVNDDTQSIFPPDVHAVMDHGKRDVSRFPIATGVYYKKDYSEGVDISRYKNIPVPTSYMAEKSKYDFVGGYDYGREAGILHVADHHVSPGKKQWTWGCGDFGKAWDRNLTDEDGPYVELMTGMYTDNQPDFTWLKPFEEKVFRQYFMPYKGVGQVKNASREAAVGLSVEDGQIKISVYVTGEYDNLQVQLDYEGCGLLKKRIRLTPEEVFRTSLDLSEVSGVGSVREPGVQATKDCMGSVHEPGVQARGDCAGSVCEPGVQATKDCAGVTNECGVQPQADFRESGLCLSVWAGESCLVSYQPEEPVIPKLPEPAKAAAEPEQIMTNEELYLTGLHIEQYRHATYLPDPYYLEGLKRDPGDIRINNAYGALLMRRGQFQEAEKYFRRALERLIQRNPNPYNSESYYLLGLCLFYMGRDGEAYDAFYKATWTNEQQEMSFYYLAAIDARKGRFAAALEMAEKALVKNAHNVKARGLKAYLLRKLGRRQQAYLWTEENLALDAFDFVSAYEQILLQDLSGGQNVRAKQESDLEKEFLRRMRDFPDNYLMAARDYGEFGAYDEALGLLGECWAVHPMLKYYEAYYTYMRRVGQEAGSGAFHAGGAGSGEACVENLSEMVSGAGNCRSGDNSYKLILGLLQEAEGCVPDYCFPNKLEDIAVLRFAAQWHGAGERRPMAKYYLGCLFYDKLQWEQAKELWEQAAAEKPDFPTVHRNLSLVYYNKCHDGERARAEMERAFALDTGDVRVFLELDQLYRKLGMSFADRLARYEAHPELIEGRDDLYVEYITLLDMTGQYERAYQCMMNHIFHPWEGGEGKITTQYVLSLLQQAKAALKSKDAVRAEELLRRALHYPENLGEGRLEGTKDNHIYYHLGLALEMRAEAAKAQGNVQEGERLVREAAECYERAAVGTDEPAGAMYYNDQPADMILYQGLALQKLGRTGAAKARFYRLLDYGEHHLEDRVKIEYFAVSLPDFLIFDDDLTLKNRVHCYYLMALGNMGLGNMEKAKGFLRQGLALEPSHMMCSVYAGETF